MNLFQVPWIRRRRGHDDGGCGVCSMPPAATAGHDDDRPSEQTLHVLALLQQGFTLTEVSNSTAVPDAFVQLIAEELAQAPFRLRKEHWLWSRFRAGVIGGNPVVSTKDRR